MIHHLKKVEEDETLQKNDFVVKVCKNGPIDCLNSSIIYEASMHQIVALTRESLGCQQEISFLTVM